MKLRLAIFSFSLLIFITVFSLWYIALNSGVSKQRILSLFLNVEPNDINYIKMYSPSAINGTIKLINDTIIINNPDSIQLFVAEMRKSKLTQLNSPHPYWELKTEIHLKNDTTIFFNLTRSTDNENGSYIRLNKRAYGGSIPLEYYRSDELAEYLYNSYRNK